MKFSKKAILFLLAGGILVSNFTLVTRSAEASVVSWKNTHDHQFDATFKASINFRGQNFNIKGYFTDPNIETTVWTLNDSTKYGIGKNEGRYTNSLASSHGAFSDGDKTISDTWNILYNSAAANGMYHFKFTNYFKDGTKKQYKIIVRTGWGPIPGPPGMMGLVIYENPQFLSL
ncbi:hypothetical protein U0X36_05295 [Bacillus thuringiensis]|uniref:hypothetical protein n=1 Tax=Bacillus thuringiensis TaxID=1428 RepID=UPI000E481830|nr:hypothetical protein [Bacillus thuringiensis]MDZ3952363.1 hypothetical protein [Bacillus thuringiensis]RGP45196.1 hypothetical protein BTW32_25805 [Bacillus thuringiensis]